MTARAAVPCRRHPACVGRVPVRAAARQGRFRGGGGRRGGGGAPADLGPLLVYADASLSRTTEGSYLSADNQTEAWYAADVLRTGTRGALVEGIHTNHAKQSVYLAATWTGANGAGVLLTGGSAAAGSAPDGTTPATMAYGSAVNSRLTQTIGTGITDGVPIALVGFFKGATAGRNVQPAINASIDGDTAVSDTLWTRLTKIGVAGTAISDVVFFENQASGAAQTVYVHAACLFESRYPLTPTRSAAAAFTSGADILTFLSAQVPLRLREGASSIVVTPEWAPGDLVSGDVRWIYTFGSGATDGLRIRHDGANVVCEAVVGGVVKATSGAIAGAVREVALTIVVDPVAATLTVNGTAGAAGTAWAWPGGVQLRVGGILGASGSEFDGYLAEPEAA